MDNKTTIQDLKHQVNRFVSERDWEQFHNPKDLAIAIAIEAAELLELFRFKDGEINTIVLDDEIYDKIKEESMDILNFLLSLANTMGFDVSVAFDKKIAQNKLKYPIKESYGNAKKYNELG